MDELLGEVPRGRESRLHMTSVCPPELEFRFHLLEFAYSIFMNSISARFASEESVVP
jgi:hypothetical protein